jgi:hypothetical protein
MMLRGKIWRDGKWWAAEVPIAGVHTQGRSRRDARAMIADAVEAIINRRGFAVTVTDLGIGSDGKVDIVVEASESSRLAAYVLRYQRQVHGISLAQAARAIGQSSKTSYARYEQGEAVPTIDKFAELLSAVAPELMLTIGERRK